MLWTPLHSYGTENSGKVTSVWAGTKMRISKWLVEPSVNIPNPSFRKFVIYHIIEFSEGRFLPLFLDECVFCPMNTLTRHFRPKSGIISYPNLTNWRAGQALYSYWRALSALVESFATFRHCIDFSHSCRVMLVSLKWNFKLHGGSILIICVYHLTAAACRLSLDSLQSF